MSSCVWAGVYYIREKFLEECGGFFVIEKNGFFFLRGEFRVFSWIEDFKCEFLVWIILEENSSRFEYVIMKYYFYFVKVIYKLMRKK